MAIRQVLADIETKVEALTPVTDPTVLFRFVTAFPSSGQGLNELAASSSHRSVFLQRTASEAVESVSGATRIWSVKVLVRLVHVWKRKDYQEAEIIRAEDVHQIIEAFMSRIPGNAASAGARIWKYEGEELQVLGDRWVTALQFVGTLGMPEVVAPA